MYSTHEETYEDTPEPAPTALNPFLQQDDIPESSTYLKYHRSIFNRSEIDGKTFAFNNLNIEKWIQLSGFIP